MGAQGMSSLGGGAGGGALSRTQQGAACGLALSEVETQLHGVNLDDLLLRTAGGSAGRKAVDEVWRDIQGPATAAGSCPLPLATQMTLEDFLSGVGSGSWAPRPPPQHHPPREPAPPPPGQHHHVACPVPRPLGVGAGPVLLDALYHDGPAGAGATTGRKRAATAAEAGGPSEKTVERRKKRMIKNRESAARSRARKQAYTHELENKLSWLEEENERLKGQKASAPPVVHYVLQQEPKNQLRRINSANF